MKYKKIFKDPFILIGILNILFNYNFMIFEVGYLIYIET